MTNWEQLYQNAACGLLTFEVSGKVLSMNKTMLSWLNPDGDGGIAAQLSFPDLLGKGSQLYYNLFVLPILELHKEANEIKLFIKTKNGDMPVLLNAVMITAPKSEKYISASVFRISDRNKFEQEILKEKNQVKAEIVNKNKILTGIAYSHAHLLRAPLANILGLIQLLELEQSELVNTEVIALLKQSAENLDAVTKEVISQSTTDPLQ